jgi:hypothetical protein
MLAVFALATVIAALVVLSLVPFVWGQVYLVGRLEDCSAENDKLTRNLGDDGRATG